MSSDVQTAALVTSCAWSTLPPSWVAERMKIGEFAECYFELLNGWQLWHER